MQADGVQALSCTAATNLGDRAADFTASVVYPTDAALQTADITLEAFHQLIGGTVQAIALHLESGTDVGTLEHGEFRRRTTLGQLEVPFSVEVGKGVMDIERASGATTSLGIAASGSAGGSVSGFSIAFAESGGFFFRARGWACP